MWGGLARRVPGPGRRLSLDVAVRLHPSSLHPSPRPWPQFRPHSILSNAPAKSKEEGTLSCKIPPQNVLQARLAPLL